MDMLKTWFAKHWKALLIELGLVAVAAMIGALISIVPGIPFPAWVDAALVVTALQTAQAKVAAKALEETTQLQGKA